MLPTRLLTSLPHEFADLGPRDHASMLLSLSRKHLVLTGSAILGCVVLPTCSFRMAFDPQYLAANLNTC